jgi:1-hydroxycarotenoid 3,4-desaturase
VLVKLDSHRSMWRALEQRFSEPKLRQLFGRYATYCGSSPFEAPATLNLIAHVEADGVYRAAGGIRGLVVGLERLARSLGVLIHYDTPVERIVLERGRARGALTQEGFFEADAVVFNGDVSALGRGLLGEAAARGGAVTPRSTRSLSAVTWTMTGRPDGIPLLHHNVFFPDDYRAEFDAIFRQQKVPGAPTVYICAQDRAGSDSAELDSAELGSAELGSPHSSGTEDERFLIIVNAPPTGDEPGHWSESERQRCTEAMEGLLEATGVALSASARSQTTPADFHRLFPGTGGALYGPRSKGARSVLSRVGAATKVPGLYLTGGSVHPGAGMPMATLSGRLAAERIREDLMAGRVSIGGSLRAATTGTTSTE